MSDSKYSGGEGAVPITADGDSVAAIVLAEDAPDEVQVAAEELQHFLEKLSGARLQIVEPSTARTNTDQNLIVLGHAESSETIEQFIERSDLADLHSDGFVLSTSRRNDRSVATVAGNEPIGTLYAAYALLEELGLTFLLTDDLFPDPAPDISIRELDCRCEPSIPRRRGLVIPLINLNSSIWGLEDYERLITQMAKLRLNYINFYVDPSEPWVRYTFQGEENRLGDANHRESGYLRAKMNTPTVQTDRVDIGEQHFEDREFMSPRELEGVDSAEEAHYRFRDMMRSVIEYAHSRGIEVGFTIDPTYIPFNFARFGRLTGVEGGLGVTPPSSSIFTARMNPLDTLVFEHSKAWLRALFETYPDIDDIFIAHQEGYWVHPEDADIYNELWQEFTDARDVYEDSWLDESPYSEDRTVDEIIETDIAQYETVRRVVDQVEELQPEMDVGTMFLFRGYLLQTMDELLEDDVPFLDFQSTGVVPETGPTKAQNFSGMGDRERAAIPRVDDDATMFGMPFYLRQYQYDGLFGEAVEAGMTGFVAQMFRARGTEHHTRFLSQGAWNPDLTPEAFYDQYANEVFGEEAAGHVRDAFELLEDADELMRWRGLGNFSFGGGNSDLDQIGRQLLQRSLPWEGPDDPEALLTEMTDLEPWTITDRELSVPAEKPDAFQEAAKNLERALMHLEDAQLVVSSKGESQLSYLISKTKAYKSHLEMSKLTCEGGAALANAFIDHGDDPNSLAMALEEVEQLFSTARTKGRESTRQFAEIIDHPSDLAILFNANLWNIEKVDCVLEEIQRLTNYYNGRRYWDDSDNRPQEEALFNFEFFGS